MYRKYIFFLLIITVFSCKTGKFTKLDETELQKTHKKLANLIEEDSIATFKTLFKKTNFDPNHVDFGTTLLFDAVSENELEICKFLLKKGADVNFISHYGTVMHWALESNKIEMANLLLKYGYDPSTEKNSIQDAKPLNVLAAFLITKNSDNFELFKKLLEKGMNPNLKDRDGACALILGCYYANSELISLLHKNGANMNIKAIPQEDNPNLRPPEFTKNQYTPLMIATLFEKTEVVKQLLSYPEVDKSIEGLENHKTAYDIALDTKNEALIALFK
ncbi:ankyrin repeat domain-containing protein [Zunongwangia sp.]|uniref:ankyrin repeat domain-containing protein n=1 Tax=Zunongwangia sp. TaxID=1965325 RepID=UPI003AA99ABB